MKIVIIPKRWLFFPHTLPIFLGIHQVFLRQIGFVWRKDPSPLGTFPIFKQRLVFRTTFLRVFISQPSGLPLCRHSSLFAQAVQNVSCVASSASECSPNAFFAYIYRVLEAVPIAEVFRFASQNCRRQGEKSREYLVYFKIFQRGRRQFGPQSWVLRLLVQLLKHFSKQLLNPFILRVAATHVITTLIQLTVLYFFLVG